MKGIIMAGGLGTRLHPLTISVSKHLLPVFDKPMIYYPLATLIQLGIKQILIITTERDRQSFERLLGDGGSLGIEISYKVQHFPNGLAEAFLLGEDFIGQDRVAMILGDNIFVGSELSTLADNSEKWTGDAVILGYQVKDVTPYGAITLDEQGRATALEEKPKYSTSPWAIPGLYFYDQDVVGVAAKVVPSVRGELEITSINQSYLRQGRLRVEQLTSQTTWFDVGNFQNLLLASRFVEKRQKDTGTYVGCIEEVAFKMGFIQKDQLRLSAERNQGTAYGEYLKRL